MKWFYTTTIKQNIKIGLITVWRAFDLNLFKKLLEGNQKVVSLDNNKQVIDRI